MYCSNCGAKLADDAKFCSACGKQTVKKPGKKKKLLKWLLAALVGVVVLILAVVLITNAVDEKKRTTVLGDIPDPEIFFGVNGDHQYDNMWYEHNIEFAAADVTKDMTDAYVDLLGSGEYPFVLDDIVDHFEGGMVRYVFEYDGWQELYDADPWQIMVEYNPNYEQVIVNICNSGNFDLVPVAPYVREEAAEEVDTPAEPEPAPTPAPEPQPAASDPAVLPDFLEHDPTGQFYMLSDSREGEALYKADALQVSYVVEQYMELLTELGYSLVWEYDNTHDYSVTCWRDFYHSNVDAAPVEDDSTGQVRVAYNLYYDWNEVHVAIYYSDGITMENGADYSGSSGGSGSSDDDFFDTCSACHGSKDCTHCGGDDEVRKFQAGIGWVEQDCTFCSGGRCPTCGGTGKP